MRIDLVLSSVSLIPVISRSSSVMFLGVASSISSVTMTSVSVSPAELSSIFSVTKRVSTSDFFVSCPNSSLRMTSTPYFPASFGALVFPA